MARIPAIIDNGHMGFRAWTGTPAAMGLAHRHHDLEANWLAEGSLVYQLGGHLVELPRRRLCLFWGAVPHRLVRTDPGTRCAWLTLPLAQVLGWGLPAATLSVLLSGRLLVDHADTGDEAQRIEMWGRELQRGTEWAAVVALEVEARCKRLLLSAVAAGGGAPGGGGGSSHVDLMAAYLAEHYTQPLRVADIAHQVLLNPTYAQSLFRHHCGMTLIEYLTHVRVAAAQRLLVTTEADVTTIALDCGFGSQSRFFEAFAAVAGTTPGRWRRLMSGA